MKAKLKGAETGHSLLKRKSEALTKFVSSFLAMMVADCVAGDFEVIQIDFCLNFDCRSDLIDRDYTPY